MRSPAQCNMGNTSPVSVSVHTDTINSDVGTVSQFFETFPHTSPQAKYRFPLLDLNTSIGSPAFFANAIAFMLLLNCNMTLSFKPWAPCPRPRQGGSEAGVSHACTRKKKEKKGKKKKWMGNGAVVYILVLQYFTSFSCIYFHLFLYLRRPIKSPVS